MLAVLDHPVLRNTFCKRDSSKLNTVYLVFIFARLSLHLHRNECSVYDVFFALQRACGGARYNPKMNRVAHVASGHYDKCDLSYTNTKQA